jgi:hypothetical protein
MKRAQDKNRDIDNKDLREFVQEIMLNEDFKSFKKEFMGDNYDDDVDLSIVSQLRNKKFMFHDKDDKAPPKDKPRDLKRLWNKHVDRTFIQSLDTVHWFSSRGFDTKSTRDAMIRRLLEIPRKDEMITSGYLPTSPMKSHWGSIGLLIKGRVTFAANDMDAVYSGFFSDIASDDLESYHKMSGVPRRPRVGTGHLPDYIIDRATFNEDNEYITNELIVDNWKPVAIVINKTSYKLPQAFQMRQDLLDSLIKDIAKDIKQTFGIDVIDQRRNDLS